MRNRRSNSDNESKSNHSKNNYGNNRNNNGNSKNNNNDEERKDSQRVIAVAIPKRKVIVIASYEQLLFTIAVAVLVSV